MKESELLARLILSTKRKKRAFSILEIANDILALEQITGSLSEVSQRIGISLGMLNQFLSVFKLPSQLQDVVHQRKIDSVAVVFLLSKFKKEDAMALSSILIDKEITSQELKILLPYRKHHPKEKINDLITSLESSKNIQVSVIKIPQNVTKKSPGEIAEIIKSIVTENSFIEVTSEDEIISIKIKKRGEAILRSIAKQKKMNLSTLIITLIK